MVKRKESSGTTEEKARRRKNVARPTDFPNTEQKTQIQTKGLIVIQDRKRAKKAAAAVKTTPPVKTAPRHGGDVTAEPKACNLELDSPRGPVGPGTPSEPAGDRGALLRAALRLGRNGKPKKAKRRPDIQQLGRVRVVCMTPQPSPHDDDPAVLAARLAMVHDACIRGVPGAASWMELIAQEPEWGCLPGPAERSLVLDTETTGLPWAVEPWTPTRYECLPAYATCRLVAVAWQVLGPAPGMEVLDRGAVLVRPDGFSIPAAATQIHHITNEKAMKEGTPVGEALSRLVQAARGCRVLVAYNLGFHMRVVLGELLRLGRLDDIRFVEGMATFCAMRAVKERNGGYRNVNLAQAVEQLTLKPMHRTGSKAVDDAEACRQVFVRLAGGKLL